MSETVAYKGKLKLCKKYKNARELKANLQDFWQSIPIKERDKYYKDIEEVDESADENMKNLLQYIYENQDGILEYRERMKKITHKIRIK